MRFDETFLNAIRDALSLSRVVGSHVTWDRARSNPGRGDFWACCPFHEEKTPSFHVDDRRGRYKCFGCEASGDHFRFLMDKAGLSFPEAVEQLAGLANMALPARDAEAGRRMAQIRTLQEACALAAQFFAAELAGERGGAARAYVAKRGLDRATIQEFSIGYAPRQSDRMIAHLRAAGVSDAQMREAGLVGLSEGSGQPWARFRHRLMFPIEDRRGRITGFGARALDEAVQPKYLNSPEGPIFKKSGLLFNWRRARAAPSDGGPLLVVEGYMDAIALTRAGHRRVVASLGTALGEGQIAQAWKIAGEPILCFDGDAAGHAAGGRALERVLPQLTGGHSFSFVFLPEGRDPDDIVRTGGMEALAAHIRDAVPASQLLLMRAMDGARLDTPERRAALEAGLEAQVARIGDLGVRRTYRQFVRRRLSDLFFQIDRQGRGQTGSQRNGQAGWKGADATLPPSMLPPPPNLAGLVALPVRRTGFAIERIVLGMCIRYPELLRGHYEALAALEFSGPGFDRFLLELFRIAGSDTQALTPGEVTGAISEDSRPVLRAVYGMDDAQPDKAGDAGPPGTALEESFMFLKFDPPFHLVERCFEHFLAWLQMRGAGVQLQEIRNTLQAGAVDDVSWQHMRGLIADLQRLRAAHLAREASLAEEAGQIRRAMQERRVNSENGGSASSSSREHDLPSRRNQVM